MRHAEAVDADFWGPDDFARPLSDLGIAKLENAIMGMKKTGFKPDLIVHSPFKRATQTAEYLSEGLSIPLEPAKGLSSGSRPDSIRDVFKSYQQKPSLLLVGHMPDIAVFTARAADEAKLLDRSYQPGEMIYLNVESPEMWGKSKVVWTRTTEDWKKASKDK